MSEPNADSLETDPRFPSGPWTGFYLQRLVPGRHTMELQLTFRQGEMTGEGRDRVGKFLVKGRYELVSADQASLALYVTRRTVSSRSDDAREKMPVSKGNGRFALYHPVAVAGLPNVSMYGSNLTALAQVYFGNEREAAQEKELVLDKE